MWVRNCAQKCSVNSVCSVREKTPQRFVCVLYHTVVAFFFSQKNTDEQNTRYFTETLSQPISQNLTANRGLTPSPSPNGEGSDHRVTPIYSPILSSPVWVTSHTTEGVSKCSHPLFYAQSPDFLKPGLCYFLKFLYL